MIRENVFKFESHYSDLMGSTVLKRKYFIFLWPSVLSVNILISNHVSEATKT